MSVQAISWAYEAAGDDANEAFVLVTLSNYADAYGVLWPSQSTLHRDCRCSIRKLRNTLKDLEARGLILRIPRWRDNGSRRSDGIVLIGFSGRVVPRSREDHDLFVDLPAEIWHRIAADQGAPRAPWSPESDESGQTPRHVVPDPPARGAGPPRHVVPGGPQDVGAENREDTNNRHVVPDPPARGAALEPSIDTITTTDFAAAPVDEIEATCLEACGPGLCEEGRTAIVRTTDVIDDWAGEGFDLEADILPVLRARTARERETPIRTWAYFTEAIRAAHRGRLAKKAAGPGPPGADGPDPPPSADLAEMIAGWINAGEVVPPSLINNRMRDELLERGLVDAETLRRYQIY